MTDAATPDDIETAEPAAADPGTSQLDFHAEIFRSSTTDAPILVGCWCEIGRTHTYEGWGAPHP
jgi:hypothetical protein